MDSTRSSLAEVEVQKATEPLAADNRAIAAQAFCAWPEQSVADALVVSLFVIVGDELAQRAVQHAFADADQLGQALVLDGAHEPLGERVPVGRAADSEHGCYPGGLKDRGDCAVILVSR